METGQQKTNGTRCCNVQVEFGRAQVESEQASRLQRGAVVELDAFADDYVDVYADGRLVARGTPVVVDGKMGVRIQEMLLGELSPGPAARGHVHA